MRYTYTGLGPDNLESGRPVAHGDVIDLSRREVRDNARLIESGRLLPTPTTPKRRRESATPNPQESEQ